LLKLQWCQQIVLLSDDVPKKISEKEFKNIGNAIEIMAEAEGLQAHKMQLHYD
jgi:histidinol dehydrogenase